MPTQAPGNITASRITMLEGGDVAEAVINERTEAFARWFSDGAWSSWQFIAEGIRDVSLAADLGQKEPTALVSVVGFVPLPMGGIAPLHTSYRSTFYRLTAAGIVPAVLEHGTVTA
jgi:hypothetical protein